MQAAAFSGSSGQAASERGGLPYAGNRRQMPNRRGNAAGQGLPHVGDLRQMPHWRGSAAVLPNKGRRMRVIAGRYRGHRLAPVASKGTRPTTDSVREAWASTVGCLLPCPMESVTALDAFAGSGALGIELLSRGAKRAVFCEMDGKARKTLTANLGLLGLQESPEASVIAADAFSPKTAARLAGLGPFDMLILDPPYATAHDKVFALIAGLSIAGGLSDGCIVSYEHAAAQSLAKDELLAWLDALASGLWPKPGPGPALGPVLSAATGSPLCGSGGVSFILEARKAYGGVAIDYFRYTRGCAD